LLPTRLGRRVFSGCRSELSATAEAVPWVCHRCFGAHRAAERNLRLPLRVCPGFVALEGVQPAKRRARSSVSPAGGPAPVDAAADACDAGVVRYPPMKSEIASGKPPRKRAVVAAMCACGGRPEVPRGASAFPPRDERTGVSDSRSVAAQDGAVVRARSARTTASGRPARWRPVFLSRDKRSDISY